MKVSHNQSGRESGYMLLAMMLMVTLMLIGLALEAPRIGQQIKREKEEELIHRGNEYKSAIRKYFRKFGQYPVSIDQLENTNNMRFLRRRYKDPFTGKDDWHILHPAEVQINGSNGGALVPGQQPGQSAASAFGQSSSFGANQSPGVGATSPTAGSSTATSPTTPQSSGDPNSTATAAGANNSGITPASSLPGASSNSPVIGGGPMVGIASISKLKSIKEINGKDHYNDWQFVYDPRLEILGGAAGSTTMGTAPIGGTNAGPGGMQQPGIQGPGTTNQTPGTTTQPNPTAPPPNQ